MKELKKVSFSSISTYLRCPKQYYWRYIMGKKEPPAIAMTEGSAHHVALEYNNKHKMKHGRDLKDSVVTEKFVHELRSMVERDHVPFEDESEETLIDRGQIWHKKYMKIYAPTIEPDMVEQEFEKELDGSKVILHGYIDLGYLSRVADYKTTSLYGFNNKKKSIHHDLQMSLYSWAAGRASVEQICLIKGTDPEVKSLESRRDKGRINYALAIAKNVIDAIDRQAFPMCSPDAWQCSGKYCGFYKMCRGKIEGE